MTVTPEKAAEYQKRYRSKPTVKLHLRDKARVFKWRKYGIDITEEEYAHKLEEQGGVCAICGFPPVSKRLSVDHCHRSKKVRGLLCYHCNRFVVGRHNLDTAKSLVRYLEKWQ